MVVAFVYGWDLTLVILSMLPLMSVFGALAAKVQTSFAQKEMEAYGQAGVIAEEVLSAVRTVVAFGGEKKEVARYEEKLEGARSKGVQRGMLTGLGGGLSFGTMFAMYGLGFWYGIKCIMDDREGEACQSCDPNSKDYLVCAEDCQRYPSGNISGNSLSSQVHSWSSAHSLLQRSHRRIPNRTVCALCRGSQHRQKRGR